MPPITKEKLAEKVAAIREKYAEKAKAQTRNFLVYGHEGTGKSRLLTTCPKPVLVASFDPGGMTTRDLLPLIDSGDIIVEDFSGDTRLRATKFLEWERGFRQHQSDGLFEHIGTYAIDSLTRWSDAMMNWIVKEAEGQKAGNKKWGIPEQRHYLIQQITAVDYIGMFCDLPCHTVCTGHIALTKDDVEGRMYTGLLMAGKMSEKVPLCFDEKWITRAKASPSGPVFQIQTRNDGQYRAETRMGGSVFEMFEEPDVQALMRKAGIDASDKPSIT